MADTSTSQQPAIAEQTLEPVLEQALEQALESALESALQLAINYHRSGNIEDAETLYRGILETNPNHPEANHNLGVLALQVQQTAAALPYLTTALQADPAQQRYWVSYIDALMLAGELDGALQALALGRQHGLQREQADSMAQQLAAKLAARAPTAGPLTLQSGVVTVTPAPTSTSAPPTSPKGEKTQAAPKTPQPAKPIRATLGSGGGRMPAAKEINAVLTCFTQRRFAESTALARSLTTRFPRYGTGWKALAMSLLEQKRLEEALESMQRAVALLPNDPEVHNSMGSIFRAQNRNAEAEACLRQALQIKPDFAEAYSNLGPVLATLGRLAEAEVTLRRALELGPETAAIHTNLSQVLRLQGRQAEAEVSVRRGLELNPDLPEAHNNLALICKVLSRLTEAEASLRCVLAKRPDHVQTLNNLGSIHIDQGRIDDAEAMARRVLALQPDNSSANHNLLFVLNYHPDKSAEEIFAAYRDYDARFGLLHRSAWRDHLNGRDATRRLKVGYVSPDFRSHSVRYFVEPLLAHHDKREVEVHLYADLGREDEVSKRYKAYADHWIPTLGLSDEALAERIRADGIDVLVDLAGHTSNNRLQVFARKPAPVSVSWLGYGYTTGLSAIDYFLTDSASSPPGSDGLFAEMPWRLKTPGYVYRPAEGMGPVSDLPAAQRGWITFGTLTRALRINHRTIRVWAEILKRVDGARLVVDSSNYRVQEMQDLLLAQFAAHGIGPERLEIGFHTPPWDLLRGVDIGLDCFPHNSGTTLFETLYMGLPYITLAGRPSVGRLGGSILEGVGHPEWIANTEEEYIEKAVALASDLPALATLRSGLRAEMEAGPLMDESGFARKAEAAYREMWIKQCEKKT